MVAKQKKYKADYVRLAFGQYFVGEESPEGEQRLFCPVCEDARRSNSPSASMNPETGMWNCLKGNHGGTIYALVKDLKDNADWDIRSEAMKAKHKNPAYSEAQQEKLQNGKARSTGTTPLPTDEKIEQWTEALLRNKSALAALLSQRGFEQKTILEFELGWNGSRYTIPVRDDRGELVNVRQYKLNAGNHDKMLNLPGHGTARLYRPDILRDNEDIVVTEGETDCILLNQLGIPAITHTAGAATFRPNWAGEFSDKNVWICYDADEAGRKGAAKAEQIIRSYAKNVYVMQMPETSKGADVTDFIHKEGHGAADFRDLMSAAMEAGSTTSTALPIALTGEDVSLQESMSQSNQNKVLELTVSIAGKQAEPYTAPRLITATCDQSKGAACNLCPIAAKNGQAQIEIREDDEQLFRFVDVPETRRKQLIKEITGARCSDRVEFEVDENYHIEELLVQPSVDDRKDDETQSPVRRTAFSVSTHRSEINRKVRIVGKNVSDHKTGKLRFVAWRNESVELDIDKFNLTPEMRARLKIFQPSAAQSPLDKCLEIASDMANNVTHIYGRDLLHVGYDLVWHSVLSFKVYDLLVQKGWLEMMVVGDTRTGKSEAAIRLGKHYRSGIVQSCEGMSFAGLVGGVQQIDGRWHMTWGTIPMNDRRLVVLDEVSGLDEKNVIDQMSSIRSSGVAQITKIASEDTSARTRLIWITNPADGSNIKDSSTGGMGAMRTVVKNAEDVARFDFAMATAKDEVASEIINSSFSEMHTPEYKSVDCEALVKWAWSLTRNDIVFSDKAAQGAVSAALDLGGRYKSDPPLIQSENVRFKVLRIAAAIAARTFSIDRSGRLLVNEEHVRDAVRFLDMIYEQEAMGYARASRKAIAIEEKAREKKVLTLAYLREHEDDVLQTLKMVGGNTFKSRDFEDFGGMSKTESSATVKQLLKYRMVFLKSRGEIGMSPTLLEAIRELEEEDFAA